MKIIISGASGFIGGALKEYLAKRGHDVLPLVRSPSRKGIFWRPESKLLDTTLIEGADVVINLCGESVVGRWTRAKIQRLYESRLVPAQFLADALMKLQKPPQVVISASAVGYYGDRGEESLDETSGPGKGHLSAICIAWEKVFEKLPMRVAYPRFGMILGASGGALAKMALPFRLGLGGRMGNGHQVVSWMAIDDLTRGIEHIIQEDSLRGPVNFVSPHPITNKELTDALGKTLHRPTFLPIPGKILNLLFGEGAAIFLGSTKVVPTKLLASGFRYDYPKIEEALEKYLL